MSCSVITSYPSARGPGRAGRWRGTVLCSAVTALVVATTVPSSRAIAQDTAQSFHYKGITITPGGYFAGEALYRTHSEEADIGSNYNSIPFDKTSQYNLSEFRGSARQSRLALGIAGSPDPDVHLSGYWESDFLTVGTTSNSNESNSYALRIRQFFGQVTTNDGWGFLAGQAWSTLTTDKHGVAGRSEHVPLTIDAQYVTGFNWARQFQLRAWKGFSDQAWFTAAVEGAASTVTAHGAPTNYLLGQVGGSLLNGTANYTTDLAPDVVAKLAFEPGFGHWEIKAIGRVFRDRIINADTSAIGSYNFHTFGGGVGFGFWLPFNIVQQDGKKFDVFDLGIDGLWGAGIGRYGSGQLPDATIRPGGQINPIRAAHSLVSLEAHPSRHLDIYAYGGAEYEYRDSYLVGKKYTGYGLPNENNSGCTSEELPTGPFVPLAGTCTGDTRALWMGVVGFWHKPFTGPAGNFQWGLQYTYLTKETWSGAAPAASPAGTPGIAPVAIDPMVFLSVRYYIP